jgi:hypothetical protein
VLLQRIRLYLPGWLCARMTPVPLLSSGTGVLLAGILVSLAARVQESAPGAVLIQERVIGSASGRLAFGIVGAIAANDSLLGIVDQTTCEIVIYNTKTNSYLNKWGGCGGGPGEFGRVGEIAWRGDSLFVVDAQRLSISVLSSGRFVRLIRPQLGSMSPLITHLGFADDSTILLGLGLLPRGALSEADEQGLSFLAAVDSRDGRLRQGVLRDLDPFSQRNRARIGRTLPMCSSPVRIQPPAIALLTPWEFRGRLFRWGRPDTVTFSAKVPEQRWESRGTEQWFPRGLPSVACGDRFVLFKWSRQSGKESVGYLEVRDLQGSLVLAKRLSWSDSTLFGVAAASQGDRFYFRTNRVIDHPAVVVFRLERETDGAKR